MALRPRIAACALLFSAAAAALALCEFALRQARAHRQDDSCGLGWARPCDSPGGKRALAERLQEPELLDYALLQDSFCAGPWKDDPEGMAAPGGRPRALFLGDSVVYGSGVPEEETATELLKGLLPRWELANLGVPGANIYQIHSLFDRAYPLLKPDAVVYVLCENDPLPAALLQGLRGQEVVYPDYLFTVSAGGRLVLRSWLPPAVQQALARSELYRLWKLVPLLPVHKEPKTSPRYLRLFSRLVLDMARRCQEDRVPLVVMVPEHKELPTSLAGQALRSAGVPVRPLRLSPQDFLADGVHLAPEGHRALAELLGGILRDSRKGRP